MNKYRTLVSNTLIFAIGTFSSKILTILMTRFNTAALGSDFITASTLQDAGNVLIPLFSLQIVDGITRFGLDRRYNKKDVFSVSLLVVCLGSLLLLMLSPFLEHLPMLGFIHGRALMVAVFVFTSCLRNICSQFVRARNMVKLYAFEGILTTFTTVIFTLLFLYSLKLGVTGFLLGIILPDFLGAVFLFWVAGLGHFVRLRGLNRLTAQQMLRYSMPLIPNAVAFWLTNSADRIMVQDLVHNNFMASVYAGAYKIPSLISLVVSVFLDAWQMSSITEEKGRARFFSKVFHAMSAVIFVGSALVILLCHPLIDILTAHSYHGGWVYVPLLVLATAFSCLCSFLGTVYMVEKRSVNNMVTTIIAAVINISLNLVFIPRFGVQGASLATLTAYVTMFFLRVIDTRRFIRVRFNPLQLSLNAVLLCAEAAVMILNKPHAILWCLLLAALILALNFRLLMQSLLKVLPERIRQKLPLWLLGTPAPSTAETPAPEKEEFVRRPLADKETARVTHSEKKPVELSRRSHSRYIDEEDGFDYEAYLHEKEQDKQHTSTHGRYKE